MMNIPEIVVPDEILREIELYVKIAKGEISWIGETDLVNGKIEVKKIFLIKQDTTQGNTKLDDDKYAEFLFDYLEKGGNVANLKLWIHSHADDNVFWSEKDLKAIETHYRSEYFVSIVTNKRGHLLGRVDCFNPFRIVVDKVPVRVKKIYSEEESNFAKEQVENLVIYHEPKVVVGIYPNYENSLFPEYFKEKFRVEEE